MATLLLTLGLLLLIGLAADAVGRRTHLPRVTLLLMLGVAIGPAGLDVLPQASRDWFPLLTKVALLTVAFLLGSEFSWQSLREQGWKVLVTSLMITGITVLALGLGLAWLVGVSWSAALVLGAVATATDPAATLDVVREVDADGPFTRLLKGIVAVDDVWGILTFSIILGLLGAGEGLASMGEAAWEIGGAVLLGVGLGLPMSYLTGRLRPGEPTREEAIGFVLLVGGAAMLLDVSELLAAVTMGAVVTNLAPHHDRAFHEIESVEQPFLVIFFVLSGASLARDDLLGFGWIGVGYVGLRVLGRVVGGSLGSLAAGLGAKATVWLGPSLLPQAGVALGLVLLAKEELPEVAGVLPVVVVATVLFELIGPVITRTALQRVGEAGAGGAEE